MSTFQNTLELKRNRVAMSNRGGKSQFGGNGGPGRVIDAGKASPFRKNGRAHRQAVKIHLENLDANNRADIILSAGKYGALAAYAAQLVSDGTNNTVNDDAQAVDVALLSKYGVDGTMGWAHWQNIIEKNGMTIDGLTLRVQTQAQLDHRFVIEKRDNFGSHDIDIIDPAIEYDANQYDGKILRIDQGFPLTDDYILKYSLEPGEKMTLTFFIGVVYSPQALMEQAAAAAGNTAGV